MSMEIIGSLVSMKIVSRLSVLGLATLSYVIMLEISMGFQIQPVQDLYFTRITRSVVS